MSNNIESEKAKINIWDRLTIASLALIMVGSVIAFFYFVHSLELITYPKDRLTQAIASEEYNYYAFALEFRERRLSLALTYRTFLTSLGFTVGLVLSAIGGLFVLRNAKANLVIGASGPENVMTTMSKAKVSLVTNSPGIAFMIGGVIVMIISQWLTIPVTTSEVYPANSLMLCDKNAKQLGLCPTETENEQTDYTEEQLKMLRRIESIGVYCVVNLDEDKCQNLYKI